MTKENKVIQLWSIVSFLKTNDLRSEQNAIEEGAKMSSMSRDDVMITLAWRHWMKGQRRSKYPLQRC